MSQWSSYADCVRGFSSEESDSWLRLYQFQDEVDALEISRKVIHSLEVMLKGHCHGDFDVLWSKLFCSHILQRTGL